MFRAVRVFVCASLGLVVGYLWLQCVLETNRNRATNVLIWHHAGLNCSAYDSIIHCHRSWCRECGGAHGFHEERCTFRAQPSARTPRGERTVHTLGRVFFMWEDHEGTTFAAVAAPFWLPFVLLTLYPVDAAWSVFRARRRRKKMPSGNSFACVAADSSIKSGRMATTIDAGPNEAACRLHIRCARLFRKYVIIILAIASAQLSYDWIVNSARLGGPDESFHRKLICVLPLIVDTSTLWQWPAIVQKARPAQGVPMVIMLPVWMVIAGLAGYPTIALIRGPLRNWRRTRRGLCVRCGYNLTGNASGRCPECGSVV